ncbi:MAG: DUF2914 domain-containing protein [Deltaproteobacteria bacterium]|nr:DUF2914 domain-containing protein [Deltaproteobacteria bacterium]
MNVRTLLPTFVLSLSLLASEAQAQVTVVRGQFTDRVERSMPVGAPESLASAREAVFWLELRNQGTPTQVTLVWRVDGHEVQRQTLDVGRGSRWRTWGRRRISSARSMQVEVLDAEGHSLHRGEVTLRG